MFPGVISLSRTHMWNTKPQPECGLQTPVFWSLPHSPLAADHLLSSVLQEGPPIIWNVSKYVLSYYNNCFLKAFRSLVPGLFTLSWVQFIQLPYSSRTDASRWNNMISALLSLLLSLYSNFFYISANGAMKYTVTIFYGIKSTLRTIYFHNLQ